MDRLSLNAKAINNHATSPIAVKLTAIGRVYNSSQYDRLRANLGDFILAGHVDDTAPADTMELPEANARPTTEPVTTALAFASAQTGNNESEDATVTVTTDVAPCTTAECRAITPEPAPVYTPTTATLFHPSSTSQARDAAMTAGLPRSVRFWLGMR